MNQLMEHDISRHESEDLDTGSCSDHDVKYSSTAAAAVLVPPPVFHHEKKAEKMAGMMTSQLFRLMPPIFVPQSLIMRRPVVRVEFAAGGPRGWAGRTVAQCRQVFPAGRAEDDGASRHYSDFTIRTILGLTQEVNDNVDQRQTTSSMMHDSYETAAFSGIHIRVFHFHNPRPNPTHKLYFSRVLYFVNFATLAISRKVIGREYL